MTPNEIEPSVSKPKFCRERQDAGAQDSAVQTKPAVKPVVGVVVPCFNQGTFARDAIESVRCQHYPSIRVVLIDDASNDGISPGQCALLADCKTAVYTETQNRGRSTVRQHGVSLLKDVDYVLMLDCDDWLMPDYIGKLVDCLESNPNCGLAYGTLHFVSDSKELLGRTWPTIEWSPESAYTENVIPGPGVMFRKSALDQTCGWRPDFNDCSAEDVDIALQVIDKGWNVAWVRSAVYYYRQHGRSFLANTNPQQAALSDLSILKYHSRGIAAGPGIRPFLNRNVVPTLAHALRHADWQTIVQMVRRAWRNCPVALLVSMTQYYLGRIRAVAHRRKAGLT